MDEISVVRDLLLSGAAAAWGAKFAWDLYQRRSQREQGHDEDHLRIKQVRHLENIERALAERNQKVNELHDWMRPGGGATWREVYTAGDARAAQARADLGRLMREEFRVLREILLNTDLAGARRQRLDRE